jgi:hypothetical protein
LRTGQDIWLTLPKVGHCAANIVWASDFEAGLEFHIPLTDDAFEALTGQ